MLFDNAERLVQMASTNFNIFKKRKVESMLRQSLNSFKPFLHPSDFVSICFDTFERGWQTVSTLLFDKIE